MTDRDLTPAQAERVRRLLADARHTEPMPDDVVARLDGVLADLADPADRPAPAPTVVTSLDAARRRRSRGRALLVAAAAVTVLGVGTPSLMNALGQMGVSGDDSASSFDAPAAGDQEKGSRDTFQSGGEDDDQGGVAPSPEAASAPAALSSEAFDAQVEEYAADAELRSALRDDNAYSAAGGCVLQKAWGAGRLLPATYDGELGMLVYRAPRGDVQRVDLYLCDTRTPVRSVLIPRP